MLPRMLRLSCLVVVCMCLLTSMVYAASLNGTIEAAGSGSITVKDESGNSQKFTVDSAAKISLDGKTAKLDDLLPGISVTVETETKSEKTVAVIITGRSPQ